VDFVSALKVLRRRWVTVLVGFGLMIVAGIGIMIAVPPTYQVKASDVLLVPAQVGSSQAGQANPYLGFGGSLGIVAQITARKMNDFTTVEQMKQAGATGEYLVDIVPGEAPMLSVTATSKSESEALRTAQIVEKAMTDNLKQSQVDLKAPAQFLITTNPITLPSHAEIQRGSQLRALAGMLVVGLAGTVLAAFVIESVKTRRRQRSSVEESLVDSPELPPVVDPAPPAPPVNTPARPATPARPVTAGPPPPVVHKTGSEETHRFRPVQVPAAQNIAAQNGVAKSGAAKSGATANGAAANGAAKSGDVQWPSEEGSSPAPQTRRE
jgi:capsular polysaccharide biosynthesis protein